MEALPEPLREALQNLWNEIAAARIARNSLKSFKALKGSTGLKVHIGAGDDIKLGWVNIDLALQVPPGIDPTVHPDTTLINHDLRMGLPLEDGSCAIVYSSHFFEHLEYGQGQRLMRDCHRVLRPGGIFRVALPNFRATFEAYLRGDHKHFELLDELQKICAVFPRMEPGTRTLVDYVNYSVYQFGEHKYIYDEAKLELILQSMGFSSATPSSFREGIDPDTPLRRRYSFYMEAVK
jgi:predicted SAM-dependent methyltransferase